MHRNVTRLSLLIFFLTLLNANLVRAQIQHHAISGIVLDSGTEQALQGAHVFIANTLIGTTTDASGRFSFTGIPAGTHTIAVSMLGYQPYSLELRLTDQETIPITIRLDPQVYESTGIEVTAERVSKREQRRRNANLDRFKDYFLGVSRFARQCTILNPEVLTFSHNPSTGLFYSHRGGCINHRKQSPGL